MSSYVLDASALLALLHSEPGAVIVQSVISGAFLSTVNWSEVTKKVIEQGITTDGLREDLEALGLILSPFSVEQAELAAQL